MTSLTLIHFDNKFGPVVVDETSELPQEIINNAFTPGQPQAGITVHAICEQNNMIYLSFEQVVPTESDRNAVMDALLLQVEIDELLPRQVKVFYFASKLFFEEKSIHEQLLQFEELIDLLHKKLDQSNFKLFDYFQIEFGSMWAEAFSNEISIDKIQLSVEYVLTGRNVIFEADNASLEVLLLREMLAEINDDLKIKFVYELQFGETFSQEFIAGCHSSKLLGKLDNYELINESLSKSTRISIFEPDLTLEEIRKVIKGSLMIKRDYSDIGKSMLTGLIKKTKLESFIEELQK